MSSSAPSSDRQVQLLRNETEIEAARRLRDAVLANISHEFKTPLAAQLASLELLLYRFDELDPGEARALIVSLQRGALRLTHLIDNLLLSVRIEAGRMMLRKQSVHLDEVVEEAVEMIRPLTDQRGQSIDIALPHPLPAVSGDGPRLIQVFVNLLANAGKFAPDGTTIRIGGSVDAGLVTLFVEDEGPGWSEDVEPLTFEPFVRSTSEEPDSSGVGLGLHIAKAIVERHGGRIDARTGRAKTRVAVESPHRSARVKVLIVDDDQDLRELIGFVLKSAGYEIVEAGDGLAAVQAHAAEKPSLVILDVNLPGIDGFEVCRGFARRRTRP